MTEQTPMDPFEHRLAGLVRSYTDPAVHPIDPSAKTHTAMTAARPGVLTGLRPLGLDRRVGSMLLLGALLAILAALALAVGTSQPPTDLGRLVFIREGDIWVANGDGSRQTKIADGGADGQALGYLTVAWSPDGRQIAAVRNAGDAVPTQRIEILTGDGAEGAIIEPEDAGIESLDWSPDGSRLAVALRSVERLAHPDPSFPPSTLRLWIVGSDGASLREIALPQESETGPHAGPPVSDQSVRWSPDGRWIALHPICHSPCYPPSTEVMAADGSGARPASIDGEVDWVTGLDWSPDGRQLAIVGVIEGCPASFSQPQDLEEQVACLGVVGVDGGPVTSRVEPTNLEAADDGDPTTLPESFAGPRFSPDGGRVAFHAEMMYSTEKPSADLPFAIPEPDGVVTRLYVHDPASRKLQRLASGTESLTARDTVGTLINVWSVTGEPVATGSIRWSPDGRRLLFLSREAGGPPASLSIRSVDAAGGSPSTVLVDGVQSYDLGRAG